MNKKTKVSIITACLFFVLIFMLFKGAFQFNDTATNKLSSATKISEFSVSIGGATEEVALPFRFQNLSARTPVTLNSTFRAENGDSIYLKSVYAPLKVYLDDNLIYEYGQEGTYPKFMQDPATVVKILHLPNTKESVNLRMEFLSPLSRDVLTVHPVLLGSEAAIIRGLFNTMGFSFVFSIIQIFMGLFLIFIAVFVTSFEKKGVSFLWLGLFALATGGWAFGESNLTALFFHNYTFLYLLAFLGLFSCPIPLIYFGLSIVKFNNKKPLEILALLLSLTCAFVMFLQLLGVVSLSKSMYLFHFLVPFSLSFLAAYLLYEAIKFKNKYATRLYFSVIAIPIFSVLELINYQLRFTNVLSLFFQLGVFFFIFMTSMIGGMFIRDSILLKGEKHQLKYEVALMQIQVESQKKHHSLLLENAEAIKVKRHDLRHQLAVIRGLNISGDKGKLTNYLDDLIEELPLDHSATYCENIVVNAIISHYVSLAEKHGIELEIKLNVPEHMDKISDSNLSVIFGNLFENAIEACRYVPEGNRFIKLHSRLQYETLTITMDNSFDGKIDKHKEKYISRKRGEVGTGIISVTGVAENHGGNASFDTSKGVFLSSVYLRV